MRGSAPPDRQTGPAMPLLRIASQWLLGVLLALALTGLFLAINAVQLTAPGTGQRILRQAVAVLTDIDALLPQLHQDLREAAATAEEEAVPVPNFPIPIAMAKEEAAAISQQALRQRLLEESARQAYAGGMDILAAADPQAQRDVELISTAGAIDRGFGLITEDNHRRIGIAAGALGFIAALLALALMLAARSYGRLVAAGACILAAALPSLAAAVALRFGFRTAEEEADPFVKGLLGLGVDALWVPVRNYIALAALGAALLALGVALLWLSARWAAAPSVDTAEG